MFDDSVLEDEERALAEFLKEGGSARAFYRDRVTRENFFSKLAQDTRLDFQTRSCLLLADFHINHPETEDYLIGKLSFAEEPVVLAALTALLRLEHLHTPKLERTLVEVVTSHKSDLVRYYALIVLLDFSDWPNKKENAEYLKIADKVTEIENPIFSQAQKDVSEYLIKNQNRNGFFNYAKTQLKFSDTDAKKYEQTLKKDGRDWRVRSEKYWELPAHPESHERLKGWVIKLKRSWNKLPGIKNKLQVGYDIVEQIWRFSFEIQDHQELMNFTEIIPNMEYVARPEYFTYEMGRVAYHEMKDLEVAKKFFEKTWDLRNSDEQFGYTELDQVYLKLIGKPEKSY